MPIADPTLIAMRKMLGLLVLVAACGTGDDPPSGDYTSLTVSGGNCAPANLTEISVEGSDISWWFGARDFGNGPHITEHGTIDGDCVSVTYELGDWRDYSLCRTDGDGAFAHQERVDGACAYDIMAAR